MSQVLDWPQLQQTLMQASQTADQFILAAPLWVQIWVGFMMIVILPSFVISFFRPEARWIAIAFYASLVLTPFLIAVAGPSPFWGMTHLFFWPIAVIAVLKSLPRIGLNSWYGRWLALAAATMTVSLVFDAYDVARFIAA